MTIITQVWHDERKWWSCVTEVPPGLPVVQLLQKAQTKEWKKIQIKDRDKERVKRHTQHIQGTSLLLGGVVHWLVHRRGWGNISQGDRSGTYRATRSASCRLISCLVVSNPNPCVCYTNPDIYALNLRRWVEYFVFSLFLFRLPDQCRVEAWHLDPFFIFYFIFLSLSLIWFFS